MGFRRQRGGRCGVHMPFRASQESGRKGWYVYVDRPKTHRPRRGGKTVRRKAGDSREEALRNALRIEAELVQQWAADEPLSPFQAALRASRDLGVRLDECQQETWLFPQAYAC